MFLCLKNDEIYCYVWHNFLCLYINKIQVMKVVFNVLIFFSLLMASLNSFAQEEVQVEASKDTFTVVEQFPKFPEGEDAMYEYLSKNIQYPAEARENNIQGRVVLKFVVLSDGTITDIRVLKGVSGGCSEEAVRVVEAMPKWNPAIHRGKPVNVFFVLPIGFRLHNDSNEEQKVTKKELKQLKKERKR